MSQELKSVVIGLVALAVIVYGYLMFQVGVFIFKSVATVFVDVSGYAQVQGGVQEAGLFFGVPQVPVASPQP